MSAGCNSESNSHSLSQDTVSVLAPASSKSDIDFAALSNDSIKKMMNDAKKMVDEANAKFDSSNKFDHEITDQNIYKTAHTFI